ncbi:MAG TPA: hypothetical protein VE978_26155, partial [Chitinophagales bacterium]|nr:hypothetical protein [Chitinophagales bacterium]
MKSKLLSIAFIFFWLSRSLPSYALTEEHEQSLTGSNVAVGKNFIVKDDKFQTTQWDSIESSYSVKDLVIFELNDDTNLVYKYPFTCTINVKIQYYDSITPGSPHTIFKNLTIVYDTGRVKKYAMRNSFVFANAFKFKITIQTITFTQTGWSGVLPKIFRVRGLIIIDRKYKFYCARRTFPKAALASNRNVLKITWKSLAGAEDYDLEWTVYHDSSDAIRKYLANPTTYYNNYDSLYRNNASRVTVTGGEYDIPLIYTRGYLFFRVRAAHYTMAGFRKTSPWSAKDTSAKFALFKYKYRLNALDSTLNWQGKVTFAEDGKRSPSLTYADGSLRSRQTVTISEAVGEAIVGETMYDHQGRPAVQTLPVPAIDYKLAFHNRFSRTSNHEYNRDDFDLNGCGFSPPPMDSSIGSSKYYSSSNSDYTAAIQKYVPDANGYSFAVTRYTPDLTGRISQQGGVGKELRMGNGHETKYYYGKPDKGELDRLFGNDVGYDSLYFKNMVVDPNGSISLSYLDGSGHTIATALAGDAPSNLQALASNTGADTVTINLLNNDTIESSLVSNYGLLIEKSGLHTFRYSLVPGNFSNECSDNSGICFDCLYDLTITLSDVCGNASLPGDTAIKIVHHNYNLGALYDTLCSNPTAALGDTFSVNLSVGEYHINKTLSVSDAGKTQYLQTYLAHDTCHKTFNDFLDSITSKIDFSGCYMNCQDCINGIGSSAAFIDHYLTNLGYTPTHQDTLDAENLYDDALASCAELCDTVHTECES